MPRLRPTSLFHRLLEVERGRFALWAPLPLGLGVIAYFSLAAEPPHWAGAAALALAGLPVACLREYRRRGMLALLLAALGFSAAQLRTHLAGGPMLHEELRFVAVQGMVVDMALEERGVRKLVLAQPTVEGLAAEATPRRLRIRVRGEEPGVVGDRVEMKAILHPLPAPAAPGAFDFARHLYFEGLGGTGYAVSPPVVIAQGEPSAWAERLTRLRLRMAEQMQTRMEAPAGAVASALTVGEVDAVPDDVRDAMRDSGLYHILSISGLHLALASGLLFVSLRFLLCLPMGFALRFPVKKFAALAALAGAFGYLLLAGSPVPAQRSFIMVAFVLAAVLFDRRGISLYALAWAAVLLLLARPEALLGASFQMSFAATLAIVSLYERAGRKLYRASEGFMRRAAFYFLGAAMTSLVAGLATAPFVLYHFSRFQPWGLVANMAAAPVVSFVVMPGVVLTFLLWPLGLEGIGFMVMERGIGWMLAIARWGASLPYASLQLLPLASWGMGLCALGLMWLTLWRSRLRLLGVPVMALGLSTALFSRVPEVLVSADGKQVMVRDARGDFALIKGSARGFTARAWQARYAAPSVVNLKQAQFSDRVSVDCEGSACQYRNGAMRLWVLTRWQDAKTGCRQAEAARAQAVVALFYLRRDECGEIPLRIDRQHLKAHGAHALYDHQGEIRAENVQAARGIRPWVP